MIGIEGNATLIVTAVTGVTFAAALVLTVLIGQRFHRDWRRLAANPSPPPGPAAASLRSAKVFTEDAERRHADRALEEARLRQLRSETEAWQERLNSLRLQAAEVDLRFQEIEAIKVELAGTREDGQALRQDYAAARAELAERSREDAILAEQAAALRDDLERDRRLAADIAGEIAEARRRQAELSAAESESRRRQAELMEAEAETRRRLEGVQAELARCHDDQETLRRTLEARRAEIEALAARPVEEAAPTVSPPPSEAAPEAPPPAVAEPVPKPQSPAPALTPVWAARGQSVTKPRNDSFKDGAATVWRRNEDRFRISETATGVLAAVSDGAGASGLYCGAWAEALVARLPDRPLTGLVDLNGWLDGFCLDFQRGLAAQAKTDPRKHSKFVQEGSFATLAACWLERSGPKVSCRWLAYGDSPLLVFDRTGGEPALVACHPDRLAVFDRDPQLLNWKTLPEPSALKAGEVALPARATVVLASDGIGQYLLLRHLAALQAGNGAGALLAELRRLAAEPGSRVGAAATAHLAGPPPGFAEELAELGNALATEPAFAALVAARCEAGLLANDDATLIMIDIESAETAGQP